MNGNVIKSAQINGDILIPNHNQIEEFLQKLKGKTIVESIAIAKMNHLPYDISEGITALFKQPA